MGVLDASACLFRAAVVVVVRRLLSDLGIQIWCLYLIRGEAVKKSVAKRRAQRGLRAAARQRGGIPGIALAPVRAVRITAGEDVMPGRRHLRACLG